MSAHLPLLLQVGQIVELYVKNLREDIGLFCAPVDGPDATVLVHKFQVSPTFMMRNVPAKSVPSLQERLPPGTLLKVSPPEFVVPVRFCNSPPPCEQLDVQSLHTAARYNTPVECCCPALIQVP